MAIIEWGSASLRRQTMGLLPVLVLMSWCGLASAQFPSRVIELPIWQDPDEWARIHKIERWVVRGDGMSQRFLITRISDQRWRTLQAFCTGEVRCYSDSCQQVRTDMVMSDRLVAVPPDLLAALAGQRGLCEPLDRSRWQAQLQALPQCWLLQQGDGCEVDLVKPAALTGSAVHAIERKHCSPGESASPCQVPLEAPP